MTLRKLISEIIKADLPSSRRGVLPELPNKNTRLRRAMQSAGLADDQVIVDFFKNAVIERWGGFQVQDEFRMQFGNVATNVTVHDMLQAAVDDHRQFVANNDDAGKPWPRRSSSRQR